MRRLAWLLVSFAVLVTAGCHGARARVQSLPVEPFTAVTDSAGIRFRHEDGSSGRKYFPEVMGPGCALADFTGDGRPDIYLVNGARLPGAPPGAPHTDRFYQNNGDGTFTNATASSGLNDPRYGIGCCAGDYDNDGRLDLYVTNLGRNTLYHNNGDGTFTDATVTAGVGTEGFSTGAAFSDYDGDGDLDLYVARYVVWSPEGNIPCSAMESAKRVPVYCRPTVYPAGQGVLYRNNGDGTFRDVTKAAGLKVSPGRSLGVLWTDVDEDGDPDLFVANDMSANFLFTNQGNGRFREEALARGVALSEGGQPQASMGVATVDYDGDGHLDLACTNFSNEYLALYRNAGNGYFEDVSARTGLLEATSPYVGFGLGFPDLNLDGYPDLFVANGHVTEAAERFYPGVTLAQPKLLLYNDKGAGFAPTPGPGANVTAPRVGRGAAFGDHDGDGDTDVLVANWKDEPDLLRNNQAGGSHWLRIALEGVRCNRGAIGARVEITTKAGRQVQELQSGGSYASQNELVLSFGLGGARQATRVSVRWPGGASEEWEGLTANRIHRLRQGTGARKD